jgi:phosphoglucosamine mutase
MNPEHERLFGTDGVRGRAGQGWLAEEGASAIGWAIGAILAGRGGPRRALLGHDGRRSGPALEAAVARGLVQSDHTVVSAGLIPTPGLAWLARARGFGCGVMISGSHNPAQDNGIKVFGPDGDKLSAEIELAIEERLRAGAPALAPSALPRLDATLVRAYGDHLLAGAGTLSATGLVLALDCANGGASQLAPGLFERLGARVIPYACQPDGDNINRGCGSTQPEALCALVRRERADLGVALDGDADRCLLVDERGALVDGDALLAMFALDRSERGELRDRRLVATVMSNRGLERAVRSAGIQVTRVGVGDRLVVEALRRDRLSLGGEQSGHIVFGAENHFIGDGILTALRALQVRARRRRTLSELAGVFRAFPQVLVNVQVRAKPPFEQVPAVAAKVRELERLLGDEGRILLRYSGTEALARIMVEGPDDAWIRARAAELARLVEAEIGARP